MSIGSQSFFVSDIIIGRVASLTLDTNNILKRMTIFATYNYQEELWRIRISLTT